MILSAKRTSVSVTSDKGGNRRPPPAWLCDDAVVAGPVVYRSLMSDSSRWDALELRDGDIVISAPSKCGMTWTQRLVSLLVFDGPDLPGPMSTVSPWLDQTIRPIEEVVRTLDAQEHRRFIKTHTPLDGLVLDDRVTYVGVGRDPRDAAVSELFQWANMDRKRLRTLHDAVIAATVPRHQGLAPHAADLDRDLDPVQAFRSWMEAPVMPPEGMGFAPPAGIGSLANVFYHLASFWRRRHLPNLGLFHYADYQVDLVGEIVRLGHVLGYDVGRDHAKKLAEYAGLDVMRARASEFAPNTTDRAWRSNERFFRAGGRGEWREIFTEAAHRRYDCRASQLAAPDLLAWAHEGRRGYDPVTAS